MYVNRKIEKSIKGIGRWVEERDTEIKTIVRGGFNARTDKEGGEMKKKEKIRESIRDEERKSKDGIMNSMRRKFVKELIL